MAFRPKRLRILALAALLLGCGPTGEAGPVVLAAASLQGALEEIADDWQAQGHDAPVLSFAGTPALARQVEGGAPADIFFSADLEWMDWLEERALLRPGTRRDVLANRLVLIAPARSAAGLWLPPQKLTEVIGQGRVAMADPASVPAGRYARAALEALGAWDAIRAQTVPAENVRAALTLVERGEVPFGIVYATDQIASDKVALVGSFPPQVTPPIRYPAALLQASSDPEAQEFLEYLSGPEAGAIFRRHGFGVQKS